MTKVEIYKCALREITRMSCMNQHYDGEDAIWCKEGQHSIYCPAGIAQKALQQADSADGEEAELYDYNAYGGEWGDK